MDNRRKCALKPQDVVAMATIQHLSPAQISNLVGISRQRVWKILKKSGVNTSKGPGGITWVKCICPFCGKEFEIRRERWRNSEQHFCSKECYYASRENPGYHPWRQGQRLAKAIVSQYFHLEPENIVHHKDGNNRNNDRSNLLVFANHSDHMKFHHGKNHVEPIWDGGANIINEFPLCPCITHPGKGRTSKRFKVY